MTWRCILFIFSPSKCDYYYYYYYYYYVLSPPLLQSLLLLLLLVIVLLLLLLEMCRPECDMMKSTAFCVVTSHSFQIVRRFGGTYRFHDLCRRVGQAIGQKTQAAIEQGSPCSHIKLYINKLTDKVFRTYRERSLVISFWCFRIIFWGDSKCLYPESLRLKASGSHWQVQSLVMVKPRKNWAVHMRLGIS
jgi:hypothetical protein